MPAKAKAPAKNRLSLQKFAREKRKEGCPVCALPSDVLGELAEARAKGIKRPLVVEWLNKVVGARISSAQLDTHYSSKHHVDDAA